MAVDYPTRITFDLRSGLPNWLCLAFSDVQTVLLTSSPESSANRTSSYSNRVSENTFKPGSEYLETPIPSPNQKTCLSHLPNRDRPTFQSRNGHKRIQVLLGPQSPWLLHDPPGRRNYCRLVLRRCSAHLGPPVASWWGPLVPGLLHSHTVPFSGNMSVTRLISIPLSITFSFRLFD